MKRIGVEISVTISLRFRCDFVTILQFRYDSLRLQSVSSDQVWTLTQPQTKVPWICDSIIQEIWADADIQANAVHAEEGVRDNVTKLEK